MALETVAEGKASRVEELASVGVVCEIGVWEWRVGVECGSGVWEWIVGVDCGSGVWEWNVIVEWRSVWVECGGGSGVLGWSVGVEFGGGGANMWGDEERRDWGSERGLEEALEEWRRIWAGGCGGVEIWEGWFLRRIQVGFARREKVGRSDPAQQNELISDSRETRFVSSMDLTRSVSHSASHELLILVICGSGMFTYYDGIKVLKNSSTPQLTPQLPHYCNHVILSNNINVV